MQLLLGALVIAGAAVAGAGTATAARTQVFRLEGGEAFRKSRLNGVTIDADARIAPGPAARPLGDAGAQVWSLLRARNGRLYAASGSDGKVHVFENGRVAGAIETNEFEVFAVAATEDGTVVAGGAPNGTILVLGDPGEAPRTLFDTPEKIVWAMVTDPKGNVYAATGERGLLYKVSPSGEARVLYRAEDSHLLSLAWSREGKLLAGTGGRGLLLEVDPDNGAGRVLYDASATEVTRIACGEDGSIYFAVAGESRGSGRSESPPASGGEDRSEPASPGVITIPEVVVGAPTGVRIYACRKDGTVLSHWICPEESIHALIPEDGGHLLVGTGGRAALYRIGPRGETSLLWRPEEGQLLALLRHDGETFAATGNPGRVYALDERSGDDAWIRPEPLDAGSMARWGRMSWLAIPGSGRWEMRTRSGHTEQPDSSWSPWSDPLADPAGSAVTSAPARFLQVEARFVGNGAVDPARLGRIWIPYAEPNRPPRIANIRFSDPGTASREGPDASSGASYTQNLGGGVRVQIQRGSGAPDNRGADLAPGWVQAVRSIAWDAEDPDGDKLVFDVGLRRAGEQRFRQMASDIDVNGIAVDTSTLPEGEYEVRVSASDELSNPPGEAGRTERVSNVFRVDHQPPAVESLQVSRKDEKRIDVQGSIRDASSPIVRLEISVDGNAWRPLSVRDGFLDGMEESFETTLDLDGEDEGNWVAVRGADAAGNEAARQIWIAE